MSLLGIVVLVVVIRVLFARRPRVVVRIGEDGVRVVRGQIPGSLVDDLRAVASLSPGVVGRVELRGQGAGLTVRTPGLDEGAAQRVRNVVFLRRNDV